MNQSESINNLMANLCAFQAELPAMPKNCSGYGYKYTDLDTIVQTIKPLLAKNHLGFIQPIETNDNGLPYMKTRLFNDKGEYLETTCLLSSVNVKGTNEVQQMGAGITYMRRYTLCSLLGITSDEDTDGTTNQNQNQTQNKTKTKQNEPVQKVAQKAVEQKPAEQKPAFKGGESTPAEKEELKSLMGMKLPNGQPMFTKEEMKSYSDMRKDKTAAEVIWIIKAEVNKRVGEQIEKEG